MARHFDKGITAAREVVASIGQPTGPAEPMTREQIESFVRGFGLSAAATRQVVSRWTADQAAAESRGYDNGYDSGREASY